MRTARQAVIFDPSYTTDGLCPMRPWGRTRHALDPAIPSLIEDYATPGGNPARAERAMHAIAEAYGVQLHDHGVPAHGVTLACAALRHAFDDAAEWMARRSEREHCPAGIAGRVAHLAESTIAVVNRSYDDRLRRSSGMAGGAPVPMKDLDLLAFAAATQRASLV